MKEYMDKSTGTNKAAKFREMAKDKSLPQDVRNAYLDKANEAERMAAKPYARGGMVQPVKGAGMPKPRTGGIAQMPKQAVMPKPRTGGDVLMPKQPAMAKGGAVKKPEVAIMIAVGKPKTKMAKGGMTKGKC